MATSVQLKPPEINRLLEAPTTGKNGRSDSNNPELPPDSKMIMNGDK